MDALMLVLSDSRFPAGAHAHSLGLEEAVNQGLSDVPAFAAARLRLVAEADARVAVAARRGDVEGAEAEWLARCPSPVLRDVGLRLGAQLLRSASAIWPVTPRRTPRPVALGEVGTAAGVDDAGVALLALYDDAATVTSAALKLLPLDPAVTTRWLAELAPQMELAARAIAADHRPLAAQPAPAAPAIELAAPVHQQRRERLFAS
ncbi:MAG TPA: urease accessory UreF family protein [Solirubrobacteraceae bacterium]|nr:urease accessory UreF family protein [Solirubrobacteraceae bacterium]